MNGGRTVRNAVNQEILPPFGALMNHYCAPLAVFADPPRQFSQCKDECVVVVDTNVLIIPYNVGTTSLADIVGKYRLLVSQNRFVVPGQVAIEFARVRPRKIAELIKNLTEIRSRTTKPTGDTFPVLAGLGEYENYCSKRTALNNSLAEYHDAIHTVIEKVRTWEWDDPVLAEYRPVLKSCIAQLPDSQQALDAEHKSRLATKQPPGYKDAAKDDTGIGDFLIWKTILHIGSTRNLPVVFVTQEEKADWVYKADNRVLAPRYELVDEFRRASKGKEFFLISLLDFLREFHAKPATIQQVEAQASQGQLFDADEFLSRKWKQILRSYKRFLAARGRKDIPTGLLSLRELQVALKGMKFGELSETVYELAILIQTTENREFNQDNFSARQFWITGRSLFRAARRIIGDL